MSSVKIFDRRVAESLREQSIDHKEYAFQLYLLFFQYLVVKRKILPHHTLQPKPSHRIPRGQPPHPHPELLIRQQVEDPPRLRRGIPHWHKDPCPPLRNQFGDAADCTRHDWGAAGQGLEDGVREGVGPGRGGGRGQRPSSTGRPFWNLPGRGRNKSRRRRSVLAGRLRRGRCRAPLLRFLQFPQKGGLKGSIILPNVFRIPFTAKRRIVASCRSPSSRRASARSGGGRSSGPHRSRSPSMPQSPASASTDQPYPSTTGRG